MIDIPKTAVERLRAAKELSTSDAKGVLYDLDTKDLFKLMLVKLSDLEIDRLISDYNNSAISTENLQETRGYKQGLNEMRSFLLSLVPKESKNENIGTS